MSTIKVDTVRPVTTDASLTLQGDSSGSGVTGLTIDSSGNTALGGVLKLKSSGNSITASDGTTAVLSESSSVVTVTANNAVIEGSSSGDLVRITQTGSGNALVVEDSANPDSSPFVVDGSGNVGIGTSSISSKLHLDGVSAPKITLSSSSGPDSYIESNTVGSVGISADETNTGASSNINFRVDGTERMRIDSSGNIGAPNGTNIYNASDQRLKQNITDLSGCLQKVILMRGVSFNWIDKFCDSEAAKTLYGLIAQELQIIDSNLVDSFSDTAITAGEVTVENPLRVNEKFIIPMLVESIKEQQALIESQQSEIYALTTRIEALETT